VIHVTALALAVVLAAAASLEQRAASAAGRWSGRLQIRDGAFVDGRGDPVLPLCAHFGEAFSAWIRDRAAVETQLLEIGRAGYDCIRFWDNLGEYSEAWRGKEVSPFSWTTAEGVRVRATPDYYVKLEQFLTRLKHIGLAAHHSRGDLGRKTNAVPLERVVAHSQLIAEIYDRVGWDVLALYEGNNEDFQNGNFEPAGLQRIVEPIKSRGALVASSCPAACSEDPSDVVAYSRGFSVRYYHGLREGSPTERLERRFTSGYNRPSGTPALGWDGEPIGPNHDAGPGVTIDNTEDVEELALLHAMTLVGGKSAATYMSQHGVFWRGPIHQQAGFGATPRVRALVRSFAPDVMRWTLAHGGRQEAVLRSAGGYYGDEGVKHGPARLDQAVSPDRRRVVGFVYGGRPPARVRNDLNCAAEVTFVAALPNEDLQTERIRLEPGATHEVDYRIGRLILAACPS
jgi:hypothetical protein